MFRVIYLWRGERHSVLQTFETRYDAEAMVRDLRDEGWIAWAE